MDDNGPSYKLQKPSFFAQTLGLLKYLGVQHVIKERIIVIRRVGDIWILVDIDIINCC
jgi:hypothetical protein